MLIYLIKNNINGKRYYGQTSNRLEKRYPKLEFYRRPANEHLKAAYSKYGKDAFTIEVVFYCSSRAALDYWEKYFIAVFKTDENKYGYNMQSGGINYKCYNPQACARISEIQKELCKDPERRAWLQKLNKDYWSTEESRKLKSAQMKEICNLPEKRLANSIRQGAKPFNVYKKDTGEFVGQWINAAQCGEDLGINAKNVRACLKKRKKSVEGYVCYLLGEPVLFGDAFKATRLLKKVRG